MGEQQEGQHLLALVQEVVGKKSRGQVPAWATCGLEVWKPAGTRRAAGHAGLAPGLAPLGKFLIWAPALPWSGGPHALGCDPADSCVLVHPRPTFSLPLASLPAPGSWDFCFQFQVYQTLFHPHSPTPSCLLPFWENKVAEE